MRKIRSFGLAFVLLFLSTQVCHALTVDFTAVLDGNQEVPPVITSAFGSATGMLTGDFGSNNFVFNYQITYSGLSSDISSGFLHNSPAGANGGVVHRLDTAPFDYTATGATSGTIVGDWRFDDPLPNLLTEALAQELLNGNIYINLHTLNFLPGEIRGQLNAVLEPATMLLLGFGLIGLAGFSRKISKR